MLYLMLNSKEKEKKNQMKLQKDNERRTLALQQDEPNTAENNNSLIKDDERFRIMY